MGIRVFSQAKSARSDTGRLYRQDCQKVYALCLVFPLSVTSKGFFRYIEFHDHILGIPVCDFHDSCAVLALAAPHLFTLQGLSKARDGCVTKWQPDSEKHWVRVETSDGFCRGVCVADFRNSKENPVDLPKTVNLLRKANSDAVLEFYIEQMAKLERKCYPK